jgi:hypothetical protein
MLFGMRDPLDSARHLLSCTFESSGVATADIELNRFAREHPGMFWPSSAGYGAIWTSTCSKTAVFLPTATQTETRYGLMAQNYKDERAALITGESTCRGRKDIDEHIARKHDVCVRTIKTANARYGRGEITALSS